MDDQRLARRAELFAEARKHMRSASPVELIMINLLLEVLSDLDQEIKHEVPAGCCSSHRSIFNPELMAEDRSAEYVSEIAALIGTSAQRDEAPARPAEP